MTIIDPSDNYYTLINVFTIDPSRHLELFHLLKDATEQVMCKLPGYISANLHISDDKKTITNYAQWSSAQDFQNMLQNKEAENHMKKVAEIAIEYRAVTYSEIWTHSISQSHIF
jgi:quinol monooxygenase YgiN